MRSRSCALPYPTPPFSNSNSTFLRSPTLLLHVFFFCVYPPPPLVAHKQADIVKSLEEYNHDIEALKHKMDSATASARAIRDDITDLRNKFVSHLLCSLRPTLFCLYFRL